MTLSFIGGSWQHESDKLCPCCHLESIEFIRMEIITGRKRTFYHCANAECPAWYIVDSWDSLFKRCTDNADNSGE